ncbi:MAG TPA: M15 family metallopeptidase [Solirubrobacterales bacterium]|nr:M15 family metallopeptidase [Solirubrobacterales bacterium]
MRSAALALIAASIASGGQPAFEGGSQPIAGHVRERIVGSSWHRGCPVGLEKLRLLRLTYWGFDDRAHRGRLVVNRRFDEEIVRVMKRLYRLRYPIRRMRLIDRYDADDHRSMSADNTSAFNCRFVAGTNRWSMHAYGLAIDLNPVENPYVSGSHVSPPAGRPYADRSRHARGMVHAGDPVVRAFARSAGWEWGGSWAGATRDFQHFSANGR